jgi:DnaJ-class molecular chaperone
MRLFEFYTEDDLTSCPDCGGSGNVPTPEGGMATCPTCKGTGDILFVDTQNTVDPGYASDKGYNKPEWNTVWNAGVFH